VNPTPHLARSASLSHRQELLAIVTTSGRKPAPEQFPRMVNSAAARIYAAWQPHIGHDAALHEARAFAGRFHILIDGPLAPLPDDAELDATLDAVATAMNPLDSAAGARGAP
jgi:hypothetical protein